MGDAMETALNNHDRSKRSSDIPLFYGTKDKDTVNPQQLVDRIERAAAISNWDAPIGNGGDAADLGAARGATRRADELYLCLRGKAISWFHTLEHIPGFDNHNWNNLKKEFLDAYAPRYTARTLCVTLQELRQRTEENVQDYYNRVSDAFRNAYKEKPDALKNFDGTNAQRGGANDATANLLNLLGVQKMQLHMMNTIFLGGLREELRSKVLEEEDEINTVQDAVKRARALEVIITEKKMKGSVVASVENEEEALSSKPGGPVFDDKMREALTQLLLKEEDNAVAAIGANDLRHRLNQQRNHRGRGKGGGGNQSTFPGRSTSASGGVFVCWYCNLTGHTQANCHKRQAAGGAYVQKGKSHHTINTITSRAGIHEISTIPLPITAPSVTSPLNQNLN